MTRAKLTAFAVSGFVAAVAGALFVHHQQAFGAVPTQPAENLAVFAMAVVGGITSLPGALLGALYLLGTRWFLPLEWQFLASGFGVLLVLMLLAGGLGGLVFDLGTTSCAGSPAVTASDRAEPARRPLRGQPSPPTPIRGRPRCRGREPRRHRRRGRCRRTNRRAAR